VSCKGISCGVGLCWENEEAIWPTRWCRDDLYPFRFNHLTCFVRKPSQSLERFHTISYKILKARETEQSEKELPPPPLVSGRLDTVLPRLEKSRFRRHLEIIKRPLMWTRMWTRTLTHDEELYCVWVQIQVELHSA
jgi:hypothetical protein